MKTATLCFITAAFEKVSFNGIAKYGQNKGQKMKYCVFKCIDKDTEHSNKVFYMTIMPDCDNKDTQGNIKQDAHYIVKNNLVPGNVFENLQILVGENLPESESKEKIFINHYNLNVKLIKDVKK